MILAILEKEVHNPLTNGSYEFRLNVCAEASGDWTSNPWYKKEFKRART